MDARLRGLIAAVLLAVAPAAAGPFDDALKALEQAPDQSPEFARLWLQFQADYYRVDPGAPTLHEDAEGRLEACFRPTVAVNAAAIAALEQGLVALSSGGEPLLLGERAIVGATLRSETLVRFRDTQTVALPGLGKVDVTPLVRTKQGARLGLDGFRVLEVRQGEDVRAQALIHLRVFGDPTQADGVLATPEVCTAPALTKAELQAATDIVVAPLPMESVVGAWLR